MFTVIPGAVERVDGFVALNVQLAWHVLNGKTTLA
jgi:hypothetical protein